MGLDGRNDASGRLHRKSMQETGRFQLGRDLLDGFLDVLGLARSRADELAAPEQEDDDLRLVDPIDEAGEPLWLVLDLPGAERDCNRIQVDLPTEVRRRDDVLNHNLRVLVHRNARGADLLRDQVDRGLDVLKALRARADDFPASEQEDRRLRFLEPVNQPGELFRLVFGAAEGAGDRLEIEFLPE